VSRTPLLLGDVVIHLAIAYPASRFGGVLLASPDALEGLLDAAQCCGASAAQDGAAEWWERVALNASHLGAPSARPLASAGARALGLDEDTDATGRPAGWS